VTFLDTVYKRLDGSRCHLVVSYGGKRRPRRRCVRWGHSTLVKGAQPPVFGSCLLWPNGWMDEDAIWYGCRPRPRPHCIRWDPSSSRKGHGSPPSFRPMSIVATVYSAFTARFCYFVGNTIVGHGQRRRQTRTQATDDRLV